MAIDFDKVDQVAATVADLYREAELALTRRISRQLAQGLDAPGWAEAKLSAVGGLRRAAQLAVAALTFDVFGLVRAALAAAYRAGWGDELAALADRWAPASRIGARAREALAVVPGTRAVDALADSLVGDLRAAHERITRSVIDGYRAVVAAAVARTVTGVATRREAAQAAWSGLVARGLVRFTDRSGREWALSSYVEMATRTVTARAATQGHLDALRRIDVTLVGVTDHPQECKLCRPWEGKILAVTGSAGRLTLPHEITGAPVVVDVADTLARARAAGLHHPNCRHDLIAYMPGVTRLAAGQPDPEGDAARQRQRYLERRIRAAKLREAAALDDSARTVARRRVRTAQAALRDHLAAHPALKRLRYREQIGAGNVPPPGRRDPAGAVGPAVPQTLI